MIQSLTQTVRTQQAVAEDMRRENDGLRRQVEGLLDANATLAQGWRDEMRERKRIEEVLEAVMQERERSADPFEGRAG